VPACDPELLAQTVAATNAAAAIALDGFRRPDLAIDRKADGSPVTHYDRAVERALREHIAAEHPGDGILGEEEAVVDGTSGRRWILDPIDGTSPFSRGVVTWATLVALDDEHGPLLGVVACPWVGEVVWAGRGLGCSWGDRPAAVSERDTLRGAVLSTSGIEWWPDGVLARVMDAGIKLKTWGNGYGLALAATGRVDAFFDNGVKPWDLGPAPVLMSEAGGVFTALDGSTSIDRGSGLLCGVPLRDELLRVLGG
jgi:histidinol-phosphatase